MKELLNLRYLLLLLLMGMSYQLSGQNPEEFLALTPGEDWLQEHQFNEVIGEIRSANGKGELRGRIA